MSRRARRWELARELKHADAYSEPSEAPEDPDDDADAVPTWCDQPRPTEARHEAGE